MLCLWHNGCLVPPPKSYQAMEGYHDTSHQIASLSSYTATIDSLRVYQQIFLWSASRKNPCPKSEGAGERGAGQDGPGGQNK